MNIAARHSPPANRDGDGRGCAPQMVPADPFIELRTRRYRTLIDAGIDPDWAWEVAHYNALETLRARQ